jgi:hypothetical protein
MTEQINEQSLRQRKIAFVNSEFADVIVPLIQDVLPPMTLIGDSDYETICNAVRFDTRSELIRDLLIYMDDIKNGRKQPN